MLSLIMVEMFALGIALGVLATYVMATYATYVTVAAVVIACLGRLLEEGLRR